MCVLVCVITKRRQCIALSPAHAYDENLFPISFIQSASSQTGSYAFFNNPLPHSVQKASEVCRTTICVSRRRRRYLILRHIHNACRRNPFRVAARMDRTEKPFHWSWLNRCDCTASMSVHAASVPCNGGCQPETMLAVPASDNMFQCDENVRRLQCVFAIFVVLHICVL